MIATSYLRSGAGGVSPDLLLSRFRLVDGSSDRDGPARPPADGELGEREGRQGISKERVRQALAQGDRPGALRLGSEDVRRHFPDGKYDQALPEATDAG